jgi:acyl-CoA reductase-like NAD-dependent aldehyde dehydrogenase
MEVSMTTKSDTTIREHTVDDLKRAVERAREAQKAWREKSFGARKKIVKRMRGSLLLHADDIARAVAEATGKTRVDALSTEVLPSAMAAAWYAKAARRFLRKRRVRAGNLLLSYKRSVLLREPWGVVGIISPWNYPFGIPFHETVMGLMAGNAVVLKVATLARGAGELIREVVEEAGVPDGLFHLIHLPGKVAGPAFIEAGVNKLFFTGSIAVGKELMRLAADRLVPVCLELGGNDAMVVLGDASLQRAVGGALWAGLSNCGQSCGGVQRIYVHERIAPSFSALLAGRLKLLRYGREREFDVEVGALATREQYDAIKAQVAGAKAAGARVLVQAGTDDPEKLLHPALVLDKVKPEMKIMQEEAFGPIMLLDTFATEDEAVEKANSTVYGLTASVWSRRPRRAKRVAARLEAGAVTINDHLMSHGLAETHWGGYKQSGVGRSHGQAGFEEMTQTKVIVNDLLHRMPRAMWWYPHSAKTYSRLKGLLDLLYSKNIGRRLAGLGKLLKLFTGGFRKW